MFFGFTGRAYLGIERNLRSELNRLPELQRGRFGLRFIPTKVTLALLYQVVGPKKDRSLAVPNLFPYPLPRDTRYRFINFVGKCPDYCNILGLLNIIQQSQEYPHRWKIKNKTDKNNK